MTFPSTRRPRILLLTILLGVITLAGLAILGRRNRRRKQKQGPPQPTETAESSTTPYGVRGLTAAEVAARQPDFDLEAEQRREDRQFLRKALRQSLVSIYNIDLFGIALILYLLGNLLAALGTLLIVALNVFLNVFQQMYTKRKLNQILNELRPQAAVIRDGALRSIEPATIVDGDHLVIRAGDEFLVNGELVSRNRVTVEQISPASKGEQFIKGPGDPVSAGSFCLEGQAVYRATESGIHRYRAAPGSKLQLLLGELTPLQRFVEAIFRILFGVVLLIGLLVVVDSLIVGFDLIGRAYQDGFSIVFGIAPTSLFFILIITYVIGTLRISERGALVYKAQSIESLANASMLCISEESLVSGFQVNTDPFQSTTGGDPISESLIRRMLGDFIHSLPVLNSADEMLAQALPGEPHRTMEIAPFLSENGWNAATFNEPDLRGTYVLGYSDRLEVHLAGDRSGSGGDTAKEVNNLWLRIRHRFSRRKPPEYEAGEPQSLEDIKDYAGENGQTRDGAPAGKKPGLEKLLDRIDLWLSPVEEQEFSQPEVPETETGVQLVFAYLRDPVRLYDDQGEPHLPLNLNPLTRLDISPVFRPETGQTIQDLVDVGLDIKMLSVDPPEEAAETALALGLTPDLISPVSGTRLEGIDERQFIDLVEAGNVIGDLIPSQKAAIVKSLRARGERVVMVGNTVADVPAMQLANLRIALRDSVQAALKLTDIVLLSNSLETLPYVLTTGQRLVNGILDLFKLYLSQIIAQLLLVLALPLQGLHLFFYHPTQAGVITLFTIALPGIFLSVWAAAGRVTNTMIRRQLAHFIIPSSLTLALLTIGVYGFFFLQTRDYEYAQLAVTYAILMAGWLRVLFVQPPTPFWVGGAPLRGDRRVIWVLLGSILIFLIVISIPLLQELIRITWLRSITDYGIVTLAAVIWAMITRTIWRSRIFAQLIDRI